MIFSPLLDNNYLAITRRAVVLDATNTVVKDEEGNDDGDERQGASNEGVRPSLT